MNIDELTLGQIKQIKALVAGEGHSDHSIPIGRAVLIRTVTMMYTGHVERVTPSDIVLATAAWIADSGRFADALANGFGSSAEIEPYPDGVVVSRGAIVDISPWTHPLPTAQQ